LADALERIDPLNEPVARMGIAADHQAGDLASLHRRYRRFQTRLKDGLGAQPMSARATASRSVTRLRRCGSRSATCSTSSAGFVTNAQRRFSLSLTADF